ncbi:MAG: hypothetical protein Q9166_006867 [cf. Caloplaca sp. 2 TL-2023]
MRTNTLRHPFLAAVLLLLSRLDPKVSALPRSPPSFDHWITTTETSTSQPPNSATASPPSLLFPVTKTVIVTETLRPDSISTLSLPAPSSPVPLENNATTQSNIEEPQTTEGAKRTGWERFMDVVMDGWTIFAQIFMALLLLGFVGFLVACVGSAIRICVLESREKKAKSFKVINKKGEEGEEGNLVDSEIERGIEMT